MNESIRQQLLQINRVFYERFADAFAASRYGSQAGWQRIIAYFPARCQVLDVGCGNGRFAHFLEQRLQEVRYVGLDGSAALLGIAEQGAKKLARVRAEFQMVDVTRPGWEQAYQNRAFDVVTALAVLHHIPGYEARAAVVRAASRCLHPRGVLILSNWRFMQNERMRRKLAPWETVGLKAADVEAGDYLLDWKKEGEGLRYAHQVDEEEVRAWAREAGLRVIEQFYADGREGDLSLYSVLGFQNRPE